MPTAAHLLTREQELHWLALKMTSGPGDAKRGDNSSESFGPPKLSSERPRANSKGMVCRDPSPSPSRAAARSKTRPISSRKCGVRHAIIPITDPAVSCDGLREIYRSARGTVRARTNRVARLRDARCGRDAPSDAVRRCRDGAAFRGPGEGAAYNRQWDGARHRHAAHKAALAAEREHNCGFWLRRRFGVSCGEPQAGGRPSRKRAWCSRSFRWVLRRTRRIFRFEIASSAA